jgi:hypothetical protein
LRDRHVRPGLDCHQAFHGVVCSGQRRG